MTTLSSLSLFDPLDLSLAPLSPKEKISRLCNTISRRFFRLLRFHLLFHLLYALAGLTQLLFIIWVLVNHQTSPLAAFLLAALFLTGFSYFVLRLILEAEKQRGIDRLTSLYLLSCRSLCGEIGTPGHHRSLASALCKLSEGLAKDLEKWSLIPLPFSLSKSQTFGKCFRRLINRMSWRTLLSARETCLLLATEEYLTLLKLDPLDLGTHSALANAYVTLATLYQSVGELKRGAEEELKPYYSAASARAIEELAILSDLSPEDPWVWSQLAYSYRDLGLVAEEIAAYEALLHLQPSDWESWFQLGICYFQQGAIAKGLQAYRHLRHANHPKAEVLIDFYGRGLKPAIG